MIKNIFPALIVTTLLFTSCADNKAPESASERSPSATEAATVRGETNSNVEVRTFSNAGDSVLQGYGYDVYIDGKIYIHQPHIPAVSGNRGFSSEADAQKAGELAAYKVRNNIMPPSITVEELDSIGIH